MVLHHTRRGFLPLERTSGHIDAAVVRNTGFDAGSFVLSRPVIAVCGDQSSPVDSVWNNDQRSESSSYQTATFTGSTWNDINPDGVRNPPEFATIRSVRAPQGSPVELQNFPWYVALLPEGGGVPNANTVYVETYFYVKDLGKVYRWSAATGSVLYTTISGKSGYSVELVTANAFAVEPLVTGATVQSG